MKLGLVGSSEGNGHPFSWPALINGYISERLAGVPFGSIRDYLPGAEKIGAQIGAEVTHVWTPNPTESRQIADFAKIQEVSPNLESLVASVDAVIHARDDYENHEFFVTLYSKFRKPVFIDKPIATSRDALGRVLSIDPDLHWIFSCSALAYDPAFQEEVETGGAVRSVSAEGPKKWPKYGIHLVEPALKLMGFPSGGSTRKLVRAGDLTRLEIFWESGHRADFTTSGQQIGDFTFVTESTKIILSDPSKAFSEALKDFVLFAKGNHLEARREQIMQIVDILEFGMDG